MRQFTVLWKDVEDRDGSNPSEPNDQGRLLLGYEREFASELTGSAQWYVEHIHDHEVLIAASLRPRPEPEETRHVLTLGLRYLALRQTLALEGFLFHSPSDRDGHARLALGYSPSDRWRASAGLELFHGKRAHTFYGRLEDASNVHAALRYFQ